MGEDEPESVSLLLVCGSYGALTSIHLYTQSVCMEATGH